MSTKRKRRSDIVDETMVKAGFECVWLWVDIGPKDKERNMYMAEKFISILVKAHSKYPESWYTMACRFLNLTHYLLSPLENILMERTIQYIKDKTESFDDYFPRRSKELQAKAHE